MPQIDAIRFRKYKSFGEEYSTIPLKRMTVLIGRNNSGKSSCIDVIEAIRDPQKFYELGSSAVIDSILDADDIRKSFINQRFNNATLKTYENRHLSFILDSNRETSFMGKEENGVSSIQIVDDFITKSEVLNDLDVRASDLLQSNGIIWVEGPSDRIYIKRWIEIWGGGDLCEGIDYQFLYYGGRLLSHYTADESHEENELISILTTNRNSAIVIDSDKTSQSKPINDTKKRIQAEFDKLNLFCWITKGKEIENYVPCQAINDKFGCELGQCGRYEKFPDYIKKIRPNFSNAKVRFASKLIDHINVDNSDSILDLKQQILNLIETVRGWTPDEHSPQTRD